MTPNNIANMSYIKGLNIISVTDHNTAENLPAVAEVCGKMGITAVPGIEVTTKEEVHVLCYFRTVNDAMMFGRVIYDSLPDIKNIPSIFGCQNIYNSLDEITGTLDKLLISASGYSLNEINRMSVEYHGIMIPAHINKKSNGILGILGFMPTDLNIKYVEIFHKEKTDESLLENYIVLKNSDAHILTDISEAENSIDLNNAEKIYNYLNIY